MTAKLPGARAALVDANGVMRPEYYRYFLDLANAQEGNASGADLAAINQKLAELQSEIDALPEPQALQVLPPLILNDGVLRIVQTQQTGGRSTPQRWVFQ
jgi:hypothetical protein